MVASIKLLLRQINRPFIDITIDLTQIYYSYLISEYNKLSVLHANTKLEYMHKKQKNI